jgi:hypothetical protein
MFLREQVFTRPPLPHLRERVGVRAVQRNRWGGVVTRALTPGSSPGQAPTLSHFVGEGNAVGLSRYECYERENFFGHLFLLIQK